MKKIFTVVAFGMSLAAASAHASSSSYDGSFQDAAPTKATFTITLSGACSGKITKTVTSLNYRRMVYYTDNQHIDIGTLYTTLNVYTDDKYIWAPATSYYYSPEEKFSETVVNGERTMSFTMKNLNKPELSGLSSGDYDSIIFCDGGQTLSQFLQGWNPFINESSVAFKTQASVVHTTDNNNAANPLHYKLKYQTSGVIAQKSKCTMSGSGLYSSDFKMACGQPKSINVKVAITAEGNSVVF